MSGFIPVVEYADGTVVGIPGTLADALEEVFGSVWFGRYKGERNE